MKIYIAGSGGMLGEAFYEVFTSLGHEIKCSDIDVNEPWLDFLDFRDYEQYFKAVKDFAPDFLFHLGAYTNLEYCELNESDTYSTNTLSVENAVLIANKLDIPVLYISTAGIYDGEKELYNDWELPNPLGVYAKAKYYGERYVVENAKRYYVCRAGWMMGGGPNKDKKYINKLMQQLKSGATELFIVNDKDGTPTYTMDFARNCELLIKSDLFGLYNMVCGGQTSRLEVTEELLNILELSDKVKITEVSSEYFAKEYFAERPLCERLDNTKLDLRGLNIMRDWRVCLSEYVNKRFGDYL
jgi:dTDP-4-dehydrorhamnose reductase